MHVHKVNKLILQIITLKKRSNINKMKHKIIVTHYHIKQWMILVTLFPQPKRIPRVMVTIEIMSVTKIIS